MGWNSWDAYGFTLDEQTFKANATQLADLRSYGWTYALIDEGWYMDNPRGAKLAERSYQLNAEGLLVPSGKRYASALDGAGFRPPADWRGLTSSPCPLRAAPRRRSIAGFVGSAGSAHGLPCGDGIAVAPMEFWKNRGGCWIIDSCR